MRAYNQKKGADFTADIYAALGFTAGNGDGNGNGNDADDTALNGIY